MGWGQKWGGQLGMGAKMGEGEAVCGFRNSCRNRNRNKTDVGVVGKRGEAPRQSAFLEIVIEKETETRRVAETETKLRFPLVALDPPRRALGAKKKRSSRKTVVWETVRICFALLSPPKMKDLTLTYHIFQGDVVVVVEAQYSEGTTHCQR